MYDELDYVYEVYKEKSFSQAAKNLFVSQPALSSSIKKLESRLGITIFDRSSQPIRLTDAGKVYIDAVERIRAIKKSMEARLNDMSHLRTGHFTVSGENYISSFIYPKIIIDFMRKYSGIKIEMVESNSHDLQNLLLNENVDLLIDYNFPPELYDAYPIADEVVLICAPRQLEINNRLESYQLTVKDIKSGKHTKKTCKEVSLGEFKDETFVILKKGNFSHRHSLQLCSNAGFEPNIKICPDQLITSYNMTRAGMGVSLIPDRLIYSSPESARCVFYKIADEQARRTLFLGFKKNRYMSQAVGAFIKTALEVYRN